MQVNPTAKFRFWAIIVSVIPMLGAAVYNLAAGNSGLGCLVLGSATLLVISAFRIRKAGRVPDPHTPDSYRAPVPRQL